MTTRLFSPSRLTLARKRRGLTMSRLADAIGVEPRSISAYEKGEFSPDTDRLVAISRALRFPVGFFEGPELDEPSPDNASFRALSRMTAAKRDCALGAGAVALMVNSWLEDRFQLPKAGLPDLGRGAPPEVAAESLRRLWGLGELPVKNMIHLLESKGIRVFSLAIDAVEVDAFSMWRGDTPFVFLNTKKSSEHSRFDAAHELGHLVMHRHGAPQGQVAEREANAFSSAFLMPQGSVLAHAPRMATIDNLIRLKKMWTVSLAALAYRLHALGCLTDWHYRTLCIEISSRGYRKREPEEAQRETSQVWAKVFAMLREDGVTKGDVARDLALPVDEIDQLVFGLTIAAVSGSGASASAVTRRRANLRVVSSRD